MFRIQVTCCGIIANSSRIDYKCQPLLFWIAKHLIQFNCGRICYWVKFGRYCFMLICILCDTDTHPEAQLTPLNGLTEIGVKTITVLELFSRSIVLICLMNSRISINKLSTNIHWNLCVYQVSLLAELNPGKCENFHLIESFTQ